MSQVGCHELGDCERDDGYVCEECRIWYVEHGLEWAEQHREEL